MFRLDLLDELDRLSTLIFCMRLKYVHTLRSYNHQSYVAINLNCCRSMAGIVHLSRLGSKNASEAQFFKLLCKACTSPSATPPSPRPPPLLHYLIRHVCTPFERLVIEISVRVVNIPCMHPGKKNCTGKSWT